MSDCQNFKNYDIIGYKIVSQFHLVALLAYARRRFPKKVPKILVVLSSGPWRTEILSPSSLNLTHYDIDFCHVDDVSDYISSKFPFYMMLKPLCIFLSRVFGFKTIDVCATSIASVKFSCSNFSSVFRFKPIIIDEGLGSYNEKKNIQSDVAKSSVHRLLRPFLAGFLLLIFKSIKFFGGSREHLFVIREGGLEVCDEVALSYKEVFGELWRGQKSVVKADVLFVTQPLVELKVIDSSTYETLLKRIRSYAEERGFKLIVKPHPSEAGGKYEMYGIPIVWNSGAVEVMVAANVIDVSEVWGFNSTSLVTLSALFGLSTKHIVSSIPELQEFMGIGGGKTLLEQYSSPLIV